MLGEWYQKTHKTEDTNKLDCRRMAAIQQRLTAVL
jgi:hypothetical protein